VLAFPNIETVPEIFRAGVFWYPGFFLSLVLCLSGDSLISWWRYPVFISATTISSLLIVVLISLDSWFPGPRPLAFAFASGLGALITASLLSSVLLLSFLNIRSILIVTFVASLATLLAELVVPMLPENPIKTQLVLGAYTLFWWWAFVCSLLLIQSEELFMRLRSEDREISF